MPTPRSKKFILWFRETTIKDIPLVGGKNASLGEMYRRLASHGVPIPNGFSVTAAAYRAFLVEAGIKKEIKKVLRGLDTRNLQNLQACGKRIRELILSSTLPSRLEAEIRRAYQELEHDFSPQVDVAVRSSATAEDLPDASFAGAQETFLNIRGEKAVLEAVKKCFASLFTARAISYREDKKFDHFKIALSVGIQKMVRSDLATSGVIFTVDTETGFKDVVLINAAWGLGEFVVKGVVTPDEFYIFKPFLGKKGNRPIISKKLGAKSKKLIYNSRAGFSTIARPVPGADRKRFCLSDREALKLAQWAVEIEQHYQKPMDIEWAKDGATGKLFIVQARPETIHGHKDLSMLETYHLQEKSAVLLTGSPVGAKIGAGLTNVILDAKKINQFQTDQVLVTEMTDPDWEPIMKKAAAIVTDRGGRTCHAAIVSRELGIPAIVGTGNATKVLKSRQPVTVSCAEGTGRVYRGLLKFHVSKVSLKKLPQTKTKIMMNLGSPEEAFKDSFIPNDGVGLARIEFIINSHIKIHPKALIDYGRLTDKKVKRVIAALTIGYRDKKQYYVDKLSQGIAIIAAAFWPKDVIVRLTDFKTNEYAGLIGGKKYEPEESNPMLGWRGASRYYHPLYRAAFELECRALKKVREEMGFENVKIMVPFCRTVEEGKKVVAELSRSGLRRGVRGLELYIMAEIPSNVVLVSEFAKLFDGFSIGSNDLAQLTLGIDRDSELVNQIADERNEAVKELIRSAIRGAHQAKRKIGICGQAPSDFPDFAAFLVKEKIDSISLNPDSIVKTRPVIARAEKRR